MLSSIGLHTLRALLPALLLTLGACAAAPDRGPGKVSGQSSVSQAQALSVPPQLYESPTALQTHELISPEFKPKHVYTLVELIDLAQQLNPSTRIAWGEAQQAAAAAGMVESTYLPFISANIVGGYMHNDRSDSVRLLGREFELDYQTHLHGVVPAITLQWLLFDFGKRNALQQGADKLALASRFAFTQAHQAVIAEVSTSYYTYNSARSREKQAAEGLRNAATIEDIALERVRNGLGTTIEAAQARQLKAQARLHLVSSKAQTRQAYQMLLGAVGLPPDAELQVTDSAERALPSDLDIPGNPQLQKAIASRPDVQALQAAHQASLAGVDSARASFMPKLMLMGFVSHPTGKLSVGTLPGISSQAASSGALLMLNIPLYDGGLRTKQIHEAQLRVKNAQERLRRTQNDAYKQMVIAADVLRTALESYRAANELVQAAQLTYDGALASYREGLTGMTLLTEAHDGLLGAQEALSVAHTAGLVGSVNLAFAMGELNRMPATASTP
ncbi:TolC family protein [Pusillimonas sp. CC-YST705]|uniref:Protein CyaE n=1 Tax=Mesopusillimonas faecipullorum TaxID=2755040 RepID=A0ABS8C834_9BURK|nr:TolC family protein [Mesopusillimonas faecipullorum]MCB5362180.1 TolC family protein [Mesopusillimonas faecipullorum]